MLASAHPRPTFLTAGFPRPHRRILTGTSRVGAFRTLHAPGRVREMNWLMWVVSIAFAIHYLIDPIQHVLGVS